MFKVLALAITLALVQAQHSEEWTRWNELADDWGHGTGQHKGQICDLADTTQGCVVLFVADPSDDFTVKDLPPEKQDNFLNTQHYEASWTLHGHGFLGSSLPRAPQDIHPVCYIANVSGVVVLGYEEGNGDTMLPCPGADHAFPFTEAQILDENADLEDMCSQCYHTVCSGRKSRRPNTCGGHSNGGVEVGASNNGDDKTVAAMIDQAGPAYHCHLTMKQECDALEHDHHEVGEGYGMDYGIYCGFESVRLLNLSYCDCSSRAGRSNGCSRHECLNMAYQGVVCGNCGGCNKGIAYESIFSPANEQDEFDGVCAQVRTSHDELGRNYSMMMCSKSLFCRDGSSWGSACEFHCENFGAESETWVDPRCIEHLESGNRRLMEAEDDSQPVVIDLDTRISMAHVHSEYPAIAAKGFVRGG